MEMKISKEEALELIKADKTIPEIQADYLKRCEKISEHCYRLVQPERIPLETALLFYTDELNVKYKQVAESYSTVVEKSWPFFKEHFNLWDDLMLVFAPLDLGVSGSTITFLHSVELDIVARTDKTDQWSNFKDSILHEFTHVDQRKTNRLETEIGADGNPAGDRWNKQLVSAPKGKEIVDHFKEYCSLPWEKEARANAKLLMPKYDEFLSSNGIAAIPENSYDIGKELDKITAKKELAFKEFDKVWLINPDLMRHLVSESFGNLLGGLFALHLD